MMQTKPAFKRSGNSERDDAIALMERAWDILEGAMTSLEDVGGQENTISQLEVAQDRIATAYLWV